MNANTIVPGNAKKVYICTAGLSTFTRVPRGDGKNHPITIHTSGSKRKRAPDCR